MAKRSVRVITDAVDEGGSSLLQQLGVRVAFFLVMLNRIGLCNGIEDLLMRLDSCRILSIPWMRAEVLV